MGPRSCFGAYVKCTYTYSCTDFTTVDLGLGPFIFFSHLLERTKKSVQYILYDTEKLQSLMSMVVSLRLNKNNLKKNFMRGKLRNGSLCALANLIAHSSFKKMGQITLKSLHFDILQWFSMLFFWKLDPFSFQSTFFPKSNCTMTMRCNANKNGLPCGLWRRVKLTVPHLMSLINANSYTACLIHGNTTTH